MTIQPVSVADAVADELRRRLLAGEYPAGVQLRDTELAEEFGVARPTVRAAVQMLVADGLLERGRGRSAAVRSFSAADAIDLYRLRRPVELAAVDAILAEGRSIEAVRSAWADFARLTDDATWESVAELDVAFHRAVFVAAGSPRLLRTFDEIAAELRLFIAQLRPAYDSIADLVHEHEQLLGALDSGSKREARAAWSAHFDDSENFFLTLLKETTA